MFFLPLGRSHLILENYYQYYVGVLVILIRLAQLSELPEDPEPIAVAWSLHIAYHPFTVIRITSRVRTYLFF